MTSKQYKTAMGKVVDMGAIMLQNESTRAVGNMSVNARGDRINSGNRVIDNKSQQIKRQHKKQVSSASIAPTTSNAALKKTPVVDETIELLDTEPESVTEFPAEIESPAGELQGGLAAAIAKAKTVQQTKLPTPRESAKAGGVKKI